MVSKSFGISHSRLKKALFALIVIAYLGVYLSIRKPGYEIVPFTDTADTNSMCAVIEVVPKDVKESGIVKKALLNNLFFGIRGEEKCINLWYDEKKDAYVLFLPSFCEDDDNIKLILPEDESLFLNNNPVYESLKVGELLSGNGEINTLEGKKTLITLRSKNLPSIFIDIPQDSSEKLYDTPYEGQKGGSFSIFEEDGSCTLKEEIEALRVRGNTSADWPKKPYQISLKKARDIYGMGRAVRWNLLSNWSDKSLIRNKITYDMAADAGLLYSPESCFADLYINGEYRGNYQLCEKVEPSESRLNIKNDNKSSLRIPNAEDDAFLENDIRLNEGEVRTYRINEAENGVIYRSWDMSPKPEDITGGYLLEIERPSRIFSSKSFFITKRGQPVTVKEPDFISEQQVIYIGGLWQEFEDALFNENGINPGTGKHYSEYIDITSFAKKYLVEEIVRNYDASSTSQYFYKDSSTVSDVLHAGPVWDYDMSLGNPIMNPLTNQHYISSVSPYGLFAAIYMDDFTLWARLYEMEDFRNLVINYYKESFLPVLREVENVRIDELADFMKYSAAMDFMRWRSKDTSIDSPYEPYNEAIDILKRFIYEREGYLTGFWVDERPSIRVYLSAGEADLYVSYVENLEGEPLYAPPDPVLEGWDFKYWTDGYSEKGSPYDFSMPYDGRPLYLAAVYENEKKEKYIAYLE